MLFAVLLGYYAYAVSTGVIHVPNLIKYTLVTYLTLYNYGVIYAIYKVYTGLETVKKPINDLKETFRKVEAEIEELERDIQKEEEKES